MASINNNAIVTVQLKFRSVDSAMLSRVPGSAFSAQLDGEGRARLVGARGQDRDKEREEGRRDGGSWAQDETRDTGVRDRGAEQAAGRGKRGGRVGGIGAGGRDGTMATDIRGIDLSSVGIVRGNVVSSEVRPILEEERLESPLGPRSSTRIEDKLEDFDNGARTLARSKAKPTYHELADHSQTYLFSSDTTGQRCKLRSPLVLQPYTLKVPTRIFLRDNRIPTCRQEFQSASTDGSHPVLDNSPKNPRSRTYQTKKRSSVIHKKSKLSSTRYPRLRILPTSRHPLRVDECHRPSAVGSRRRARKKGDTRATGCAPESEGSPPKERIFVEIPRRPGPPRRGPV
ncbi:hypothetical protein KM043_002379 [Ampulex compressa]|nr:hypothetical protein KM043_002379 [Ampulex compressa]